MKLEPISKLYLLTLTHREYHALKKTDNVNKFLSKKLGVNVSLLGIREDWYAQTTTWDGPEDSFTTYSTTVNVQLK